MNGADRLNLEEVKKLILPYLEEHNLELFSIERVKEYGAVILRVSIDKTGGIDLDTLAECNEYLSNQLDTIDKNWEEYMLEVCSPGAERVLRNLEEVKARIGEYIHIELVNMIYEGTLENVIEDVLHIRYNAKGQFRLVKIPYQDIKLIRLAVKV